MASIKTVTAVSVGVLGTGTAATAVYLTSGSKESLTTEEKGRQKAQEEEIKQQEIIERSQKDISTLGESGWIALFEFSKKTHAGESSEESVLKGNLDGFKQFCKTDYSTEPERTKAEKLCFTQISGESSKYIKILSNLKHEAGDAIENIEKKNEQNDEFLKQIKGVDDSADPLKKLSFLMQYCGKNKWVENIPSETENYCSFIKDKEIIE